MSIRPEFAAAILSGDKAVEFRKRPVADDVSHVLIYATLPVGSLLGWFLVQGQSTTSPRELWDKFNEVAGISEARFFEYYAERESGTGIHVGLAEKFSQPLPLAEIGAVLRPPQSFQYLTEEQAAAFFRMVSDRSTASSN